MARPALLAILLLSAVASAATHQKVLADLADRARAQPPEFAADALLRIAAAPEETDIAWRRQLIEDAFHAAAAAQQPYPRRHWTGKPASLFDKAYAQGLDACTLQCRAVHALLELDYKKARELFAAIPPPRLPQLSCDDALVYDVSIYYTVAGEIAARAFNAKEIAADAPYHLLEQATATFTSPVEAAPVARMLTAAPLKNGQFETLVDSFAAALQQLSGDGRSFAATVAGAADKDSIEALAAECTRRRVAAQPLLDAWHAYLLHNLKAARCTDIKLDGLAALQPPISSDDLQPASVAGKAIPQGQCQSPECTQLATQFSALAVGGNGYALTAAQKLTPDWGSKMRLYLSALADWKDSGDPAEFFQFKTRFYSELYGQCPDGPDRDLLLNTLLNWLQNNAYARDHRVEWFYAVNTLIIRTFSDRRMQTTLRALRESSDPVIALYAQLEQLLPRPMERTIDLM